MDKNIQKLTQNERYDLKRKQVMEEKEAYTNSSLENFTEHCFSSRLIDRLTAENERLKEQINKEIHINRKMKSALEKYANKKNWSYNFVQHLAIWGEGREDRKDGPYIARTVLNEIDNKE